MIKQWVRYSLLITLLLLSACQPGGAASLTQVNPTLIASPSLPRESTLVAQLSRVPDPTPIVRTAEITAINGTATQRIHTQDTWSMARVGQALSAGNQVRTEDQSRATIDFTNGTLTRLGPNTLLTITELSGTDQEPIARLRLLVGEVFVLISRSLGNGKLEIQTPVGIAAVRGTYMGVRVTADNRVVITCLETKSSCRVENDEGRVELQSGQQTEILADDQPPTPPHAIEQSEVNNWLAENPEAESVINEDEDGDGYRVADGDCNDSDAAVYPNADDPANDGLDQNCDGVDATQPDEDGDGYTVFGGDCDDLDPNVNPVAEDVADDGLDQNCDGLSESSTRAADPDEDGDSYAASVDCNDSDPVIHPDGNEVLNDGLDQDCNGEDETTNGVDDPDEDGDGYAVSVDCNDNDPNLNPGTVDIAGDGVDQNCDGYDEPLEIGRASCRERVWRYV